MKIGELLNLVGFSGGIVLYAMLLAMVVRARQVPGAPVRFDPLLLLLSLLGLVWNLCALPAYELPKVGINGPFPFLTAAGFGALGLLPSVVVHSVLRGERVGVRGSLKQVLTAVAYSVSVVAAVLHLNAALEGAAVPSPVAMRLLTYTFLALIVPLAAVTRGQAGARRALWAAALAVFAVSALHLSQLHRGDPSWPVELLGHHASLPLAVAILYQDYPFAFADLFLKRALSLLAILTVAFVAITTFGVHSSTFAAFVARDPRQVGVLVMLWAGTALMYPGIRRLTMWFVDSVILRRPDYRQLRSSIARQSQTHDDVPSLLSDVSDLLRQALSSRTVAWQEWWPDGEEAAGGTVVISGAAAGGFIRRLGSAGTIVPGVGESPAAVMIISTTDPPRYVVAVGALTGGRRFLSDDVATLEAIAIVLARRIDAIRIMHERYDREIREREIGKLASEAELRALRAQINPHFLFNALTTIGYLIQTAPPRALQTLMDLTELLRAVLRSEGEFTTLGRELEVIEAYLDIERARFDERLRVTIDLPRRLRAIRLPAFVLQPLVENAVKHGIAQKELGGEVTIRGRVDRTSHDPRQLVLTVQDTGAGASPEALQCGRQNGVGLRNVEQRLRVHYGPAASLSIESTPGFGTVVEVRVPVAIAIAQEREAGEVVA